MVTSRSNVNPRKWCKCLAASHIDDSLDLRRERSQKFLMKICNLGFSAKFSGCRDENVNQMPRTQSGTRPAECPIAHNLVCI